VQNSQSFSTAGSSGAGTLVCGGGTWPFVSNTNYGNLYTASNHDCDGTVGNLLTLNA